MSGIVKKVKDVAAFSGKTGGVIGVVVAFVGDFLLPIAPIGSYVAIGALLALLVASMLYAVLPSTVVEGFCKRHELNRLREVWFVPLAAALVLLAVIAYSAYYYSANFSDDGGGVMATLIPEVEALQRAVGVVDEIRENTEQMVVEQQETNRQIATSVGVQQQISENTGRMVEQQELTNRALVWNQQTLHDALVRGDLEMLQMFHGAGHDLRQVQYPASSAPLSSAMIVDAVRANHFNIDQVLTFLDQHGYLEPAKVYDSRSGAVPSRVDALWQKMELQNYCQEFSRRGDSFEAFQAAMRNEGYSVPDSLANTYGVDGNIIRCQFIGGPTEIKTSLLIEALYAQNEPAIQYLREQPGADVVGYIDTTYGARILIRPDAIAAGKSH